MARNPHPVGRHVVSLSTTPAEQTRVLDAMIDRAEQTYRGALAKEQSNDLTAHIGRYIDELNKVPPYNSGNWSYGVDEGSKYLKLWRRFRTQDSKSIVVFIDRETGDIYRADSWKARGRPLGVNIRQF